MEINRFAVEETLKRHKLPDGGFFRLHSRNIYETEIERFIYGSEIPDENGSPSSRSIESIKILKAPTGTMPKAILHFWCHEDGYLSTEIGLMELRPRYLLIKYW